MEQFLGFKQSVHLHFVEIRRRVESTERGKYIGVEGGKNVRKTLVCGKQQVGRKNFAVF